MKAIPSAWPRSPRFALLRIQTSRTRRALGYRLATGAMWVLVAITTYRLLRSEWHPQLWAATLRGLSWVTAFAALSLTRPSSQQDRSLEDLARLRGVNHASDWHASLLAYWWPLARLYGWGAVLISLVLVWQSRELTQGFQNLAAILLALTVAAGFTAALAGLARLCEWLAPQRPKALLLVLLLVPALLRSGAPEVPSLIHLHHHLVDLCARSMQR